MKVYVTTEATYSLQRRLIGRDCAKWRTVAVVDEKHRLAAMGAAVQMGRVSEPIEWRVVGPDHAKPLAHWTREKGWM